MPGSPPKIGDAGRERVRLMAARKHGVTVPEVAEEFDVTVLCARRFVLKLTGEGVLVRTNERRRRYGVFGRQVGPGGYVYRQAARVRAAPDLEWQHSRSWSRRKRWNVPAPD
jgi:predicted ArsR family transcriptional regulator